MSYFITYILLTLRGEAPPSTSVPAREAPKMPLYQQKATIKQYGTEVAFALLTQEPRV